MIVSSLSVILSKAISDLCLLQVPHYLISNILPPVPAPVSRLVADHAWPEQLHSAVWAGGQGHPVGETQGAQGSAAHNTGGEVYREIDKSARRPLDILLPRNVKCL